MTDDIKESTLQGFRLSPQQKNLWKFGDTCKEGSYQAVCEALLEGNLQEAVLQQAARQVVARHEILRTTFQRPTGIKTPFQVVSEDSNHGWQVFDLSAFDEKQQKIKIRDCFVAERQRSFDLNSGPTLRLSLLKLSGERHSLIVSLPAICGDSVSLANFVGELARAYEACLHKRELVDEPMQYADFAEWQHELLNADDEHASAGKAYWRKQLTGSISPSQPFERPTVEPPLFELDSNPFQIDRELLRQIEDVARTHEVSLAALLFTCWKVVIGRLAGSLAPQFLIFNLSAGRKFEDLQTAIGVYAKYLPILCDLDRSWSDQLQRAAKLFAEGEEWEEYFDPTDLAFRPEVAVAFEFAEGEQQYKADGLLFRVCRREVCLSPFKIKLSCVKTTDSIEIELHFNGRVFDPLTVESFAGYFQRLLSSVAEDPRLDPAAIDLLSVTERTRLLVKCNQTTTEDFSAACIHELFETQAQKTPTARAVVGPDQELSYAELNARANQVAHLLRQRGVRPNVRVGLCMDRSAYIMVGLIGILKAGGAYVPLNPEHPPARLALQLAESQAVLCLTNDQTIAESLEFEGDIVDLRRDRDLLRSQPENNPGVVISRDDLVYVIYTSGSTGVPKGVAVRQGNLANYTQYILRRLHVDSPLHFATVSTITADLGNTCIFPALVSGGCLHILSYAVAMEESLFSEYLVRHLIDVLKIVPSHLSLLFASAEGNGPLPAKYLILGGEALTWDLVEEISARKSGCKIINHYGPTETTVGSLTCSVQAREMSYHAQTVPIGRPIANTQAYILDRHLRPALPGVAGELYIGGAGVSSGYLNQPAETASRFVPDPFSRDPDSRLYRTGDLARHLPDGNIEFLGRVDNQVKIRGYRVELGEIETTLLEHPLIRQAVVVNRRENGDEKLVAYFVASGSKPPTRDEVRQLLKQKLPDYMVPSAFVALSFVPLTANGKIDRASLPPPDESRGGTQTSFVSPRTEIERELAGIWSNLLKLNEVGVHDNFFELGGHSLLATQVVSQMRKKFAVEIPLRSLFESPTVAGLALEVERLSEDTTAVLLEELETISDEEAEQLLDQERKRST